jgi:hypothetical protein
VRAEFEHEHPGWKVQDLGTGEGNDTAVEWHIECLDSVGQQRKLVVSYEYDADHGWHVYSESSTR